MAVIKVDYTKLDEAANAVEAYAEKMASTKNSMDIEITWLKTVWDGKDADAFMQAWNKVDGKDSVHSNMRNALLNYAKYLRYCAQQYKSAQADAINRANNLPK